MERGRRLFFAAMAALTVVVGASAAWLMTREGDQALLVQEYNQHAATFRALAWPRGQTHPAPPEGQPAAPRGLSAAELYREAWNGCQDGYGDSQVIQKQVTRAIQTMGPTPPPEDREAPPHGLPGDACRALGLEGESPSNTASAWIDEALCARMERCRGALLAFGAAPYAPAPVAPMPLFDGWSASAPHNRRSARPLMHLARMNLLMGHLRGREVLMERALATLQAGLDVSRGGGMIGSAVGASIQKEATLPLASLLLAPDLPPARLRDAAGRLLALASDPIRGDEAILGEYLEMTPGVVPAGVPLDAPPSALPPVSASGLLERAVFRDYANHHRQLWAILIGMGALPFPQQLQRWDEALALMDSSHNPLAQIATPDYQRYLRTFVASQTRLVLLAGLTGAALHRQRHQRWPEHLSDIEAALGAPLPADPLTDAPIVLEAGPDGAMTLGTAYDITALSAHDAEGLRWTLPAPETQNPEQ